jgi:hypothetical protein
MEVLSVDEAECFRDSIATAHPQVDRYSSSDSLMQPHLNMRF